MDVPEEEQSLFILTFPLYLSLSHTLIVIKAPFHFVYSMLFFHFCFKALREKSVENHWQQLDLVMDYAESLNKCWQRQSWQEAHSETALGEWKYTSMFVRGLSRQSDQMSGIPHVHTVTLDHAFKKVFPLESIYFFFFFFIISLFGTDRGVHPHGINSRTKH